MLAEEDKIQIRLQTQEEAEKKVLCDLYEYSSFVIS